LAVDDPDEASRSAVGAAVQAAIAAGDGLVGWAVSVDDLDAVAARLGVAISTVSREGMTARVAGIAESLNQPCLPFFIERPPDQHSGIAAVGAAGIAWIEVAGDARRLDEWLGGARLSVRVVDGHPAVRAVAVGERQLRSQ
jgi:hypothetical protein